MQLPTISVVTPSFNQAKFLRANIDSVLSQGYPHLEHIVIDGGSTDGSVDILRNYNHLRWISELDRGQTHALNKGFRMATGEVIGWLNSDDTYCPDVLREVGQKFEDRSIAVLCGDGYEIDAEGHQTHP